MAPPAPASVVHRERVRRARAGSDRRRLGAAHRRGRGPAAPTATRPCWSSGSWRPPGCYRAGEWYPAGARGLDGLVRMTVLDARGRQRRPARATSSSPTSVGAADRRGDGPQGVLRGPARRAGRGPGRAAGRRGQLRGPQAPGPRRAGRVAEVPGLVRAPGRPLHRRVAGRHPRDRDLLRPGPPGARRGPPLQDRDEPARGHGRVDGRIGCPSPSGWPGSRSSTRPGADTLERVSAAQHHRRAGCGPGHGGPDPPGAAERAEGDRQDPPRRAVPHRPRPHDGAALRHHRRRPAPGARAGAWTPSPSSAPAAPPTTAASPPSPPDPWSNVVGSVGRRGSGGDDADEGEGHHAGDVVLGAGEQDLAAAARDRPARW